MDGDRPEQPDEPGTGGRTFKILVRPLRTQSFDLIPDQLREGDHVVRVTESGSKIYSTPRGVDHDVGLELAFQAIREALGRP